MNAYLVDVAKLFLPGDDGAALRSCDHNFLFSDVATAARMDLGCEMDRKRRFVLVVAPSEGGTRAEVPDQECFAACSFANEVVRTLADAEPKNVACDPSEE